MPYMATNSFNMGGTVTTHDRKRFTILTNPVYWEDEGFTGKPRHMWELAILAVGYDSVPRVERLIFGNAILKSILKGINQCRSWVGYHVSLDRSDSPTNHKSKAYVIPARQEITEHVKAALARRWGSESMDSEKVLSHCTTQLQAKIKKAESEHTLYRDWDSSETTG